MDRRSIRTERGDTGCAVHLPSKLLPPIENRLP
jgi:hypothetical protein